MKLEVASDVICPWCYIGKRRLERALSLLKNELSPQIRWLPFQLNPGMPKEGVPPKSWSQHPLSERSVGVAEKAPKKESGII